MRSQTDEANIFCTVTSILAESLIPAKQEIVHNFIFVIKNKKIFFSRINFIKVCSSFNPNPAIFQISFSFDGHLQKFTFLSIVSVRSTTVTVKRLQ